MVALFLAAVAGGACAAGRPVSAAHECIGEMCPTTGSLAKAKAHLATLDGLCMLGCEEYTTLKEAVAAPGLAGRPA